jgi:hypothetical protein
MRSFDKAKKNISYRRRIRRQNTLLRSLELQGVRALSCSAQSLFGGTISGPNAKVTGCSPSANGESNWYVVTLATFGLFDEGQRSTISTYHKAPRTLTNDLLTFDYLRLRSTTTNEPRVCSILPPLAERGVKMLLRQP